MLNVKNGSSQERRRKFEPNFAVQSSSTSVLGKSDVPFTSFIFFFSSLTLLSFYRQKLCILLFSSSLSLHWPCCVVWPFWLCVFASESTHHTSYIIIIIFIFLLLLLLLLLMLLYFCFVGNFKHRVSTTTIVCVCVYVHAYICMSMCMYLWYNEEKKGFYL